MAVLHVKDSNNAEAVQRSVSTAPKAAPAPSKEAVDGDLMFHPDAVRMMNDTFGIDIRRMMSDKKSSGLLHDLKNGNVTEAIDYVVTPLVYDREQKRKVPAQPVKLHGSLRVVFPYDEKYQPVGIDSKKNKASVWSYPVYLPVDNSDDFEYFKEQQEQKSAARSQDPVDEKDLPHFNDEQIQALERVGINPDRLFGDGRSPLTVQQKRDLLAGNTLELDGVINVDSGFGYPIPIKVRGDITLHQKDGHSIATIECFRNPDKSKLTEHDVLDLGAFVNVDNVTFSLVEKEKDGYGKYRNVTNALSGRPVPNRAAEELVKYGMALRPVEGWEHTADGDVRHQYMLSVVNGGPCYTRLREMKVVDAQNNTVMEEKDGKKEARMHYVVPVARVDKKGQIQLKNFMASSRTAKGKKENPFYKVSFASDKDRENYISGFGGVVKDARWYDGSQKKVVKFDAFVINDNRKNGNAHAFSPEMSQKIIEGMNEGAEKKVERQARRKSQFSVHF